MSLHPAVTSSLLGSAVACAVLGGWALLVGVRRRRVATAFLDRARETEAELVELRAKDLSLRAEPETVYFAVVRFVLPDGEVVEAECVNGSTAAPGVVGDRVAVRYDPEESHRVSFVSGEDEAEGAGSTAFVVGRGLLALAVALPVAWAVLEIVLRTR